MNAIMYEVSDDASVADDRALVREFLSVRDEESFLRLYRLHTPLLFRVAVRMMGGSSAAEEAVQEAWVRALSRLRGFEWRSSLRTWLTGILINCCREGRRSGRSWIELHDEHRGSERPEGGLRIDLERALASLPDGYRSAIVLHEIEGFTHEEIGAILGIEPGTSKSQLSHARRALRNLLRPDDGDDDE